MQFASRWRPAVHRSTSAGAAVIVSAAIVLALLLALLVGSGAWLPLIAVLVLVIAVGVLSVGFFAVPQSLLRGMMPLAIGVVILSPAVTNLTHVPIGYVMELLVFGLLTGALARAWQEPGRDVALRAVGILFSLFLVLGVMSSALGRSHLLAGIWQFQYNLKWFAMFLVGMLLVWDADAERMLRRVVLWAWLPLLAGVVLEVAAPGAHHAIFGPDSDMQPNPFIGALRRYRGPLQHAGYLALIAGMLGWCSIVFAVARRRPAWLAIAAAYVTILVSTGQRQESMGFVLALATLAALRLRRHFSVLLVVGMLGVAAVVTAFWIADYLPMRSLFAQWGWIDPMEPLSERAILSAKGFGVANRYFPLGAGLGTYGGAGAQKFDQSLFLDLGFGRFWWFREGKFLVDVYWPSVAAESGWFGLLALAGCYTVILATLFLRLLRDGARNEVLWLALGCLVILLSNTPSSASITDPRSSLLPWVLVGAAWRASSRRRLPVRAGPTAAPLGVVAEPAR